ncbi:PTS glucitol/sorbitol transporter subunit IIB [uncultured Megasphaera sp.]|uniref:PTS glucitol/sorbitol transporter subunit IIB n=1 Tax=uncultured Megasphaera sp. TaxID=165188 RepID=UPI00262C2101|nr:PTS glucitol/sorbitol transporter subunit IIB [uncultured Megasphaera sp.]
MYKPVIVRRGSGGWGGPLTLVPTEEKHKIVSITGGGIHLLAVKIADMCGGEAVDGFSHAVPEGEILAVVIDCGGTARCGVYPRKNIMTINVLPVGKSGALARFMTPELYVSDVKEANLDYADESSVQAALLSTEDVDAVHKREDLKRKIDAARAGQKRNIITRIGISIGQIVNKFYAAGRETIDVVIKNILPFMAFVSMILGIINASGIGTVIANTISPVAGTLPGMLVISFICAIPFISPILGPGAVIAQVVGTLVGAQIALGNIPVQYALPALFAIDAQVGADFVPVGLSLGEADPDTIELGVPAVLYSRVITGPLSVLIAYAASIGLY